MAQDNRMRLGRDGAFTPPGSNMMALVFVQGEGRARSAAPDQFKSHSGGDGKHFCL